MQIQFVGFENQDVRETILKYLRNRHEYQVGSIAICLDWPEKSKLPETDFRVLVLQEPSVVKPWQYKKKLRQEFDLVIPMSPWRASSLGYEDFVFQPYDGCRSKLIEAKVRTKKIVMINSAKFSASARSNYGLRRETSKLLHKKFSSYELYGDNWKMSKFRELQKRVIAVRYSLKAREKMSLREAFSELFYRYPEYKGPIKSKETVLTVSQLSLVIENESDCITEKLFDSICSGCVPVYVGPKFADLFPNWRIA